MTANPPGLLLTLIALIVLRGFSAEKYLSKCAEEGVKTSECVSEYVESLRGKEGQEIKQIQCEIYRCIQPLQDDCSKVFDELFSITSALDQLNPELCLSNSKTTEATTTPAAITLGIFIVMGLVVTMGLICWFVVAVPLNSAKGFQLGVPNVIA